MIRVSLPVACLCACLLAAPAFGATPNDSAPDTPPGTVIGGLQIDPQTGAFTEPPPPPGGWQAFADLLEKASPPVDTAIPLTPAQITQHIAGLIDAGRAQDALALIQKRASVRAASGAIGTDVQLQYQHARALAALGHHDQATALWQQMTEDYPELPEPWNALAVEYARQGQLLRARDALDMALVSDPAFAPALDNLGRVQMRLAQESFARARAVSGQPDAAGDTPPDSAAQ